MKIFFLDKFQSVLPWRKWYYFANCRNLWIFWRVCYGFSQKKKPRFLILARVFAQNDSFQENMKYAAANLFFSNFRFFFKIWEKSWNENFEELIYKKQHQILKFESALVWFPTKRLEKKISIFEQKKTFWSRKNKNK